MPRRLLSWVVRRPGSVASLTQELAISNQTDQSVKGQSTVGVVGRTFVAVSILFFVISLTQDGFFIDRESDPRAWAPCIGLLLIGWMVVFEGVFAWLANPVLAVAWFLMWKSRRVAALTSAILALVFSLSFLFVNDIITNEAGGRSKITGYGLGYWLWVGSIAIVVIGGSVTMFISSAKAKVENSVPREQ